MTDLSTAYLRWVLVCVPFYLGEEMLQTFVAVNGEPGLVTTSIVADNLVNVVVSVALIKFCGLGIARALRARVPHGLPPVAGRTVPRTVRRDMSCRSGAIVSRTSPSSVPVPFVSESITVFFMEQKS